MAYPFPRKDIRDHVTALVERYHLDQTLRGRPDIVGHGGRLLNILKIADPDERRAAAKTTLAAWGTTHVTQHGLASALIKFSEFDPGDPALGLAVPAGVRHSLYQFSPMLQLAAESAPGRKVSGITIVRLPLTQSDLTAYLYRSVALPLPLGEDDQMDLDDPRAGLAEAFEEKFGFSLEAVAQRLIEISASNPDLYLLLMSREVELGEQKYSALRGIGSDACWESGVPFLNAMKAIYELQRAAVMAWTLRKWAGVTITDMKHLKSTTALICNAEMVSAFASKGGKGYILDQCQLHAKALLRYLKSNKQWAAVKDLNGMLGSLKVGKLGWDHLKYSSGSEAGLTIPQSVHDNCHQFRRPHGKGQGVHGSRLDLYCGLDADPLIPMAYLEIGRWLGQSTQQLHFDHLIAAHHHAIGKSIDRWGSKAKHRRDKVMRFSKSYLPSSGWGSAGRFDPSQWGKRFADRPFWQTFVASIHRALSGKRSRRSSKLRLLDLALLLVTRRFKAVFARFQAAPIAIDLMCDLATSVCQLTTEPILGAILTREEHRRNQARDKVYKAAKAKAKAKAKAEAEAEADAESQAQAQVVIVASND